MRMHSARSIWMTIAAALLIACFVFAALLVPVYPTIAQPRATAAARITASAGARIDSIDSTADARQGDIQATATAFIDNARASATALLGNAQATVTARMGNAELMLTSAAQNIQSTLENRMMTVTAVSDNFRATADAVQTVVAGGAQSWRATVTAVSATLQAAAGEIPLDLEALLAYLVSQGSLEYDAGTSELTLTYFITEDGANQYLDFVMTQAGYNPDNVRIDTQPGLLLIILNNIGDTATGEWVLSYQLLVIDGDVVPELVGISYNAQPVSTEALDRLLSDDMQMAAESVFTQTLDELESSGYEATVETLDLTEDGALVVISTIVTP